VNWTDPELAVATAVAVPVAVALVVALGLALLARRRQRERAAAAETRAARERDEREHAQAQLRRTDAERRKEAGLLIRLRQSWRAEREWNRELRGQIASLHDRTQPAEGNDLQTLILRAAIELVEAEKGLLISREDEDGDGALDLVLAHGFDHDPEHSAVVQRFARDVLARDEIVREDEPSAEGEQTDADREIHTLVAIPVYLRDNFHGVIVCANRSGGFEEVGDELLLALGDHASAALHQGRLRHELRDAHRSALRVLTEAVAAHDPVLHRETAELAVHAGLLAQELGFDERERDVLVCATMLRSVGYLALPDRPRLRSGPLTSDERALIELHPRLGFSIISQAPALHDVAGVVLYHHERYDGVGYPAGLAGADIPLPARALALLEAYGAMTHERPYRVPLDPEAACEEIVACAGAQFDPEVAEILVEQVRRRPQIVRDDVSEAVLEALPLEPTGAAAANADGLVASAVDGLTLLGDRRALQQDVSASARHLSPFALVLLELSDLERVNAEDGFAAGDRLVQLAARSARRAAGRLGGTAYRLSGRRLAVVVPVREGHVLAEVLDAVRAEFLAGPDVAAVTSAWEPGETGEATLARARAALKAAA